MTGWLIFGCVLLALFLISLIRVGGFAEYSAGGLKAVARVGLFRFQIYPTKPKKPAAPVSQAGPSKEPEKKPGGDPKELLKYLPLVTEAAGQMKKKIRIDQLNIDFLAAAADPVVAALSFGGANAAIGMLLPPLEHTFHVKERRVRTAVDFQASAPTVYVHAALSLTIGQGIIMGLRLLIMFLKIHKRKE